jgi:uncharacterized protein (DUF1778 family)
MKKYQTDDDLSETVQTRMTKSQLEQVKDAAASAGLSLAAFLRFAAIREARKGGE